MGIIATGIFVVGAVFLGGRPLDLAYYSSQAPGFRAPVWLAILQAAALSAVLTGASYAAGMAIGFTVGWTRASERPVAGALQEPGRRSLRAIATAVLSRTASRASDFFVELVRGTPLLVQLLFVWSAVLVTAPPSWSLAQRSLVAGVIAMTINTGAFQSEIFRAGILAVPHGQLDAARAVGFSRLGAMRSVVLPQTFRLVTAPLTNEFISLFKSSSLLFLIGIVEVTSVSKSLISYNPRVFEVFVLATAVYLLFTLPLARAAALAEQRFRIPGLGLARAAG